MNGIGKVRDALGLLASIMALSSLVYGAFQEPLYPYMQGIMGGVMDVYRTMRDGAFAGLGIAFSGVINSLGNWLSWLPPAPWMTLPPWSKDFLTAYSLFGLAQSNAVLEMIEQTAGYYGKFQAIEDDFGRRGKPTPVYLRTPPRWVRAVCWPFYLFLCIYAANKYKLYSPSTFFEFWIVRIGALVAGSAGFFLLVYAENRIGL